VPLCAYIHNNLLEAMFLPCDPKSSADLSQLRDTAVIWRCLHVLLLACHRVRGLQSLGAEYEAFPASLRQLIHTAHCIQTLQR
jgi:hypothetical protein